MVELQHQNSQQTWMPPPRRLALFSPHLRLGVSVEPQPEGHDPTRRVCPALRLGKAQSCHSDLPSKKTGACYQASLVGV
eukprot:3003146-Rhodomonas_salina.1